MNEAQINLKLNKRDQFKILYFDMVTINISTYSEVWNKTNQASIKETWIIQKQDNWIQDIIGINTQLNGKQTDLIVLKSSERLN